MSHADSQQRVRVMVAFLLVYIFWGSTYLGIGIGVKYFPPALMTGIRFVTAGALMLLYCALSGRVVAVSLRNALRLAVIGILLLSIANMTLVWAEEAVPTGLAALIVAVVPIWLMVVDTWILRGDHVSLNGYLGLLLGITGVAVLIWPKLNTTGSLGHRELLGCVSLLGASLSWSIGSVLSRRWKLPVDPFTATGWQMLIAGSVNLVIGLVLGQHHRAIWGWQGLAAVAYLIVFGSWVGYSAYIWLLNHVPVSKVGTYAYVNPVVAVLLGWLFLHERVDRYIVLGSVIIIASVVLVTRAKVSTRAGAPEPQELPACESSS